MLAAGIVYVASVVADVLTFSIALALASALLGAATAGFAFYASSHAKLAEDKVSAQLAEACLHRLDL